MNNFPVLMGDDKKLGKSIAWVKHLFGFWLANALISNLSTINLNFFSTMLWYKDFRGNSTNRDKDEKR